MPAPRSFIDEVVRLDKTSFSIRHGFRAAVFVVAPLVVGLAIGHPEFVLITLGAMFVTNTEGSNAAPLPLRFLILACFTESSAFAMGTLVGLAGLGAIPLGALGVSIALIAAGKDPRFAQVGKFTAILFAVGIGLPGGSESAVLERFSLSLVGVLLGLSGAWLHRSLASRPRRESAGATILPGHFGLPRHALLAPGSEAFREYVAVGLASGFGLAIGSVFGLPRDFWIVVTIIIASRPRLWPTITSTTMIVLGAIAGALVAAPITLEIANVWVLELLLLAFGTLMFATRGVNIGLTQFAFTPFVIILLNILYPGEWQLAELRVLDMAIGGAIAIATVYLLWLRTGVGEQAGSPPREV